MSPYDILNREHHHACGSGSDSGHDCDPSTLPLLTPSGKTPRVTYGTESACLPLGHGLPRPNSLVAANL